MTDFKVSFDRQRFTEKPSKYDMISIGDGIAGKVKAVSRDYAKSFVKLVGENGCTFCPATFKDGARNNAHFEQAQQFVLDFNGGITPEDVTGRAERYGLPVFFSYSKLDDESNGGFKAAFLNDVPVSDVRAAEIIQELLLTVFPEADSRQKDVSKMCLGGKRLLHFDEALPTIDLESAARGMSAYLHDRHGKTHFKEKIAKFAEKNGIALDSSGFLDITVTEDSKDSSGTLSSSGNKMPNPIILSDTVGKKFPTLSYRINLTDNGTISCSSDQKTLRTYYRPSVLSDLRGTERV